MTRIGALELVHMGLSKEAANFQARSAFMGVGFTTSESELVVDNPVRRKFLTFLIFLGNAGVIKTISSVIFSFLSLERSNSFLMENLFFLGLMFLFWVAQSN